jgi:hypothetical protein
MKNSAIAYMSDCRGKMKCSVSTRTFTCNTLAQKFFSKCHWKWCVFKMKCSSRKALYERCDCGQRERGGEGQLILTDDICTWLQGSYNYCIIWVFNVHIRNSPHKETETLKPGVHKFWVPKSLWQIHFVWWHWIFVGSQYRTCSMSPF